MKKVVTILLALVLALSLGVTAMAEGISYALVTDVGNIDDQSFNQGTWEGVKNFAAEKGLTENVDYAYYKPSEDSDDARLETIKAAIDAGAKVVVLPGYLFDAAVMTAAGQYPDVNFLAVDLDPDSFPANVTNIKYTEEVSGYLAGYAVVKDGYTKLGFLGGINVPAVIRYGFGYIQGADAAAQELGVQVSVKYWYSGSFAPTMRSRPRWTAGTPTAPKWCSPAAAASSTAASLRLKKATARSSVWTPTRGTSPIGSSPPLTN